ncbi:sensor domain-containing diguanylate cyclase [Herbaspirillum sp. ST 5-3]|uniref:GGDEF domain-containing protein n=1 Tax=Oxalobacteraceae TaxID=75682 RepID=UPI0010A4DCD9|nr:sensor domain-containing diguanylate cyclase [Herbaspirillum sp. ST 5-3]
MLDPKTRIRLRTTALAGIDYVVGILSLFAYAAVGTISYAVPLKILLAGLIFNTIFLAAIASGSTRHCRDPSLTGMQVTAACGINLVGVLMAPQVTYMFIANIFVPLAYAVLHFSRRAFLVAWVLLSVAWCSVLWLLGAEVGIAVSTRAEQTILMGSLVLVFARFIAINAEVSRLRERLHVKNKNLADATARLAELATHDELTGIWNRRKFMDLLQEERMRAERTGSGFCVAIVDVDHFKTVNDRFGHGVGDVVLKALAALLQNSMRATDRVARFGGEEFTFVLVDYNENALPVAMERMREAVERHDWQRIAPGLAVTVSAGVAAWRWGESTGQVLNRADTALYEAKNAGRNCIRIAPN